MTGTPKTLGKYHIVKELGRGSFSVVYLADGWNGGFSRNCESHDQT